MRTTVRVRDLPQWLEEFADDLEDTELHAPAHIFQDSDSERPTKVVSKSRKPSIYTHFPQDRNCEVCLRTKMTTAPCRRRTGEALPRPEKFGDLITADHKSSMRRANLERTTGTLSLFKQDLATQWIQSYPCKNKDFTTDGKEFMKVPRDVAKTTSYLYGQFIGVWQIL